LRSDDCAHHSIDGVGGKLHRPAETLHGQLHEGSERRGPELSARRPIKPAVIVARIT
jgi:hypothetical protein